MAAQETMKTATSSVLSGTGQDSNIDTSVCVDEQGRRQVRMECHGMGWDFIRPQWSVVVCRLSKIGRAHV